MTIWSALLQIHVHRFSGTLIACLVFGVQMGSMPPSPPASVENQRAPALNTALTSELVDEFGLPVIASATQLLSAGPTRLPHSRRVDSSHSLTKATDPGEYLQRIFGDRPVVPVMLTGVVVNITQLSTKGYGFVKPDGGAIYFPCAMPDLSLPTAEGCQLEILTAC